MKLGVDTFKVSHKMHPHKAPSVRTNVSWLLLPDLIWQFIFFSSLMEWLKEGICLQNSSLISFSLALPQLNAEILVRYFKIFEISHFHKFRDESMYECSQYTLRNKFILKQLFTLQLYEVVSFQLWGCFPLQLHLFPLQLY